VGQSSISGSVISNNVATPGGGGVQASKPVTITDTTITGNAGQKGDGIYVAGVGASLTNVTISGNTATSGTDGGRIFNETATMTLRNFIVSGNTASAGPGGGIHNFVSQPTLIVNSTISGNGGGVFRGTSTPALNVRNTIIAGNADSGGQAPDCSGASGSELTSQGFNLIQSTTGCALAGDLTGNVIGVDPMLGPLADNGGPTLTHGIPNNTPAIDSGNPATPDGTGIACEAPDQRGSDRTSGKARDIGAFEGFIVIPLPTVLGLGTVGMMVLVMSLGATAPVALRRRTAALD
jgi:hypothetical protein